MSSKSCDEGRLFLAEQRIFEIEKELKKLSKANDKPFDITAGIRNQDVSNKQLMDSIDQRFEKLEQKFQANMDSKFVEVFSKFISQPQVLTQV